MISTDKIKVYVGDVSRYLSDLAYKDDPSAQMLTSKNYRGLVPGTYYVSIGDLSSLEEFGAICNQADEIIYCPPEVWSDGNMFSSAMKQWTEDYLTIFAYDPDKKIVGFEIDPADLALMTELSDSRKSQEKQIWIAGCSISHGIGVNSVERYGHLISKNLNLPASFLTRPGASVSWAADQILRSDVKSGDIIFWGITSPYRFTCWNEFKKSIVSCSTQNSWQVNKSFFEQFINQKFVWSEIMLHQSVCSVLAVVNFCQKLGVQLVLGSVLLGIEKYLANIPNFLPLVGMHGRNSDDMFLDIGEYDHPGVKSHQYYADKMLEKYYQLYQHSEVEDL